MCQRLSECRWSAALLSDTLWCLLTVVSLGAPHTHTHTHTHTVPDTQRGLLGSSFVVGKHWSSQNTRLPDSTCHPPSFLLRPSALIFPSFPHFSSPVLGSLLFIFVLCAPLAAGIKVAVIARSVAPFSPRSSPPLYLCCPLKSSLCFLFPLFLVFSRLHRQNVFFKTVYTFCEVACKRSQTKHIEINSHFVCVARSLSLTFTLTHTHTQTNRPVSQQTHEHTQH